MLRDMLSAALALVIIILGLFVALAAGCTCNREVTFTDASWRWQHSPILVRGATDFGWHRELEDAVARWNAVAGCEVMRVTRGREDVYVQDGDDLERLKGTSWLQTSGDHAVHAEVYVHGVGTNDVAYVVLLHELGRTLGLATDLTQTRSAMSLNVAEQDALHVRITHADAEAVDVRYCR